jgi:hypothetical protein
MKPGTPVTAVYGSDEVHGHVVTSTTVNGEPVYFVRWATGTCWFNAPLLRPTTTTIETQPEQPTQLRLF